MKREEIPRQPQAVGLWGGQNGDLRAAKNPFLECPLWAQSGHSGEAIIADYRVAASDLNPTSVDERVRIEAS
jgi:hypothetical protein